jgi:hypothetical protein
MDGVQFCFDYVAENLAKTRVGSGISCLEVIALGSVGLLTPFIFSPEVSEGTRYSVVLATMFPAMDLGIRAITGEGVEGIFRRIRNYVKKGFDAFDSFMINY